MDYELCRDALADLGWTVEEVCWRVAEGGWDQYDAVYPCTAWDYPDHLDEFTSMLEQIENSSARLVNELALLRWNLHKSYLRDLQAAGADIVPSLWRTEFDAEDAAGWFEAHGVDRLIIKPAVGANAQDTFALQKPLDADTQALLQAVFQRRAFLVQPFIESIRSEGEFSLFYFGGTFSHGILKIPVVGDFRSQEEFGSEIKSVQPEAALLAAGDRIVALVEPPPVYARVDLLRGTDGRFLLMELELIEPSLYFRTDAAAAGRFAAVFDAHCRSNL